MGTAYLYVRVSTDEQKKKGNSLLEQENRLTKYCEVHNIRVKDIFREDYSAKNFNRPEWKRLLTVIKKDKSNEINTILFLKWDRFSRNIELAYEMIGILRKHHTQAIAIDQPVELSVPESSVVLAFYLSIPEAENNRRALNTIRGIRLAKEMGRYPNKAPLGFTNTEGSDGRKCIKPILPDAKILIWAFEQVAKNLYAVDEIRRMINAKGLKCSKSNFWKLIRNPVYCGFVRLNAEDGTQQLVKAIHEPLISENLYKEVQNVIGTERKAINNVDELKSMFILKGYLRCPDCGHLLTASVSKGRSKKYAYYHCVKQCKQRIRTDLLNESYYNQLQQFTLSAGTIELFTLILKEVNTSEQRAKYLQERRRLISQISEQKATMSKARKLLVAGVLRFDDFSEIKGEYINIIGTLTRELNTIDTKLKSIENQFEQEKKSLCEVFTRFQLMDTADRRLIISKIPPKNLDIGNGGITIQPDKTIAKILQIKTNTYQLKA